MFKLTAIAAIVALLSACSSMSGGSMTGSSGTYRSTMGGSPGSGMGNGVYDSSSGRNTGGPN